MLTLWAPAPAARLVAFRVLVGAYAAVWSIVRLPEHLELADRTRGWEPVGILAPLGEPLPVGLAASVAVAVPVLAVAFAAGWRYSYVAPVFAVVLLVQLTLASSWGQIFHTENLLALHVLVLAAAPAAGARLPAGPTEPDGRYGWPLRVCALVVVVAYVLAAVAKVRASGWSWAGGDVLRDLVAHDNLRKDLLGDTYSPLGVAAVRHGWLFPPLAVVALAVELGAPVALLGGRITRAWIGAAWCFHVGVLVLMAVAFPYQLAGVAFAPFVRLERISNVVRAWTTPSTRPSRTSAAGRPSSGP